MRGDNRHARGSLSDPEEARCFPAARLPVLGGMGSGPALVLQEAGLLIFSWKRGIGQETH